MRRALRRTYRAWHDRLLVAATHGARRVLGRLGVRRALLLADALAGPLPYLLREPTQLAREHLALALPDLGPAQRAEIVRDVGRWVEADGLEVMDEALAAGRGVVAITGHIGNWELLAAFFAARGYPVTVIATRVKGVGLSAENIALRARLGVGTVLRDGPGASRDVLRTLKRGRILAIVDGPGTRHRVTVRRPDLSEPASGRHGAQPWVVHATAALTALIEDEVRRHPPEWVWWHRRWRSRSSTEPIVPGIAEFS